VVSSASAYRCEEDDVGQSEEDGIDRRGALKCMTWAGTGVLWTLVGGVARSSLGISEAKAQAADGFTFLQVSDSHIGFKGPANPNPMATLEDAIERIRALPRKPAFMIHTGDITHLSKPDQFDDADQAMGKAVLDTFYVPGEHDILDPTPGKAYMERYGKRLGATGTGWYSFDQNGVHFVGLVNVANLKMGGMGNLGAKQLAWLADDLTGRSASTPIVLFAHIPLWTVAESWGWGTEDAVQALSLIKPFGSVTVLNGHVHQVIQKIEGALTFHTARSTAFPQPAPGTAPQPTAIRVQSDKLRSVLGITNITVKPGTRPLAITDSELDET
jgi:3',5'-cyclic-AMP phosphodiesterase